MENGQLKNRMMDQLYYKKSDHINFVLIGYYYSHLSVCYLLLTIISWFRVVDIGMKWQPIEIFISSQRVIS